MDRRQLKKDKSSKHHHAVPPYEEEAAVLVASTSSDNESTACQEIVSINDDGLFQTDVAVSNDPVAWAVALTACGSQTGKVG